jgi:hypothetical protein
MELQTALELCELGIWNIHKNLFMFKSCETLSRIFVEYPKPIKT